jgi:deoxycytidylate deaminase
MSTLATDTIVIGLTGSIGSGCTFIAKQIEKAFGYSYFSLSDILRGLATDEGMTALTVQKLQEYGDQLRAKNGSGYLAHKLIEILQAIEITGIILVDSIRNDVEVQTLKQLPYFYLFSVHADEQLRHDRTIKDKKFASDEEFQIADERDKAEEFAFGQQVAKCNDLADVIIHNNENYVSTTPSTIDAFIRDIQKRYINLIEVRKTHTSSPEHLPSKDETYMTMAYAESQRSHCLKRKVGAIITMEYSTKVGNKNAVKEAIWVISSGHNEVPLGITPCVFDEKLEKCYRDYLQEGQAGKYKCCPRCGTKISLPNIQCPTNGCDFETTEYLKSCPKCKAEFDRKYICPNKECGVDVFGVYLKGGGKLLDMCKALHAEENALLSLVNVPGTDTSDLTLYTTTYPCNLCANKIVAAGIKNVVYADPYTMREASLILEAGNVATRKFQGIKSVAFFKLYS